jgi:hypothetical protein
MFSAQTKWRDRTCRLGARLATCADWEYSSRR